MKLSKIQRAGTRVRAHLDKYIIMIAVFELNQSKTHCQQRYLNPIQARFTEISLTNISLENRHSAVVSLASLVYTKLNN